jgi:hypothetical protein
MASDTISTGQHVLVEGGFGLNNTGLLIETTGAVTPGDEHTFTIDDGSGLNIKVLLPSFLEFDSDWTHVSIVGVSSTEMIDDKLQRLLRVRDGLEVR